ncbi:hypothetical protein B5K11_28235 [Rhizobium leguminosarum bv. trifolii]|nr:hypothetical protein B5K11_28235 [Rhizobium leguminosarum bv. trifolii]
MCNAHDALKTLREEGKDCFLQRLKKGVKDGDLPPEIDINILVSTLNTLFHGMSIQARDGVEQSELENVAASAMSLIPAKPSGNKRKA